MVMAKTISPLRAIRSSQPHASSARTNRADQSLWSVAIRSGLTRALAILTSFSFVALSDPDRKADDCLEKSLPWQIDPPGRSASLFCNETMRAFRTRAMVCPCCRISPVKLGLSLAA